MRWFADFRGMLVHAVMVTGEPGLEVTVTSTRDRVSARIPKRTRTLTFAFPVDDPIVLVEVDGDSKIPPSVFVISAEPVEVVMKK